MSGRGTRQRARQAPRRQSSVTQSGVKCFCRTRHASISCQEVAWPPAHLARDSLNLHIQRSIVVRQPLRDTHLQTCIGSGRCNARAQGLPLGWVVSRSGTSGTHVSIACSLLLSAGGIGGKQHRRPAAPVGARSNSPFPFRRLRRRSVPELQILPSLALAELRRSSKLSARYTPCQRCVWHFYVLRCGGKVLSEDVTHRKCTRTF